VACVKEWLWTFSQLPHGGTILNDRRLSLLGVRVKTIAAIAATAFCWLPAANAS